MASTSFSPYTHLLFFVFFLYFFASSVSASVPAIYIFGDSFVDVGNNNHLTRSIMRANFPHNGVDYPGGIATGRFSNGKNIADFVAEKLGVPTPPPYLSIPSDSNKTQAFLHGVNFASAGSGISNYTHLGQCISLGRQIDHFTSEYIHSVLHYGSTKTQDHLSKSVFYIMVGTNDIERNDMDPPQLVDSIIRVLGEQLQTIYNLGARKFAFAGTHLIGCNPAFRNERGHCDDELNKISLNYAQRVASLLEEMKSNFSDMNYSFFNSSLAFLDILHSPTNYGFKVVESSCCGPAYYACNPSSSLCPDRSNHLFWDGHHPTEASAKLLAGIFFGGSSPYVYPINVEELGMISSTGRFSE